MESSSATPPDEVLAAREAIADLVNQNRLLDSQQLCATARHAFPADPWLATMQSYILLRMGESERAGAVAAEAIGLGSEDPLAVLVLGVSHRNRGRHAEAAEALLTASRQFPDRTDAAIMLIEETVAAHGIEAGRAAYEEACGRLPDHAVTTCWARILFDAELHDEMPFGVVSAPYMSVPTWVSRTGSTLDFAGEQEVIRVEDPLIFGEPPSTTPAVDVRGYGIYASILRDATIFAKSSIVLTADGVALNDTLADERFGRFVHIPHETMVICRDEERLLLDVGRYQVTELDAGVMLSGGASEHFGHWVPEYLCKLAYLEQHPRFPDLPIIVDADMPPQHVEFLGLLVPNPIVEIPAGTALRCRELLVASPSTFFPVHLTANHEVPRENQGGMPTRCFRFIQSRILERVNPPPTRDRKLYLSRKSSTWRLLTNEDEITAALAARGFEIIYPGDVSFIEQVQMFQSASVVVAPNGSSLLNAIYSPSDLKLIVLSQRGLFNWGTFNGCMTELGYKMIFVCGDGDPQQKHANYAIAIPDLLAALESMSE